MSYLILSSLVKTQDSYGSSAIKIYIYIKKHLNITNEEAAIIFSTSFMDVKQYIIFRGHSRNYKHLKTKY